MNGSIDCHGLKPEKSYKFKNPEIALTAINSIDNVIQIKSDVNFVLDQLMDVVLEIFNSSRAWLFHPCNPKLPYFAVTFESSTPEYPGANTLNQQVPMTDDMADYCRRALSAIDGPEIDPSEGQPITNDIAIRFNVKSMLFMALRPKSGEPWMFGLHQCNRDRVWTSDEKQLFHMIGQRITICIDNLLYVRQIRENEALLNYSQQLSSIGSFVWDLKTDDLQWSKNMYRIHGIDENTFDENLTEILQRSIHPDDQHLVRSEINRMIEAGHVWNMDFRIIRSDGEERIIRSSGEFSIDKSGRPIKCIGVHQDITDHKKSENALRDSEKKFRTIIENTIDWVWQVDNEGIYNYVSPQAEQILGYKPSEIIGKTPFDFMRADEADRVKKLFIQISSRHEKIIGLEDWMLAKDGKEILFETNATPLFNEQGDFNGYMGTCRDISERKANEQALKKSEKRYRDHFSQFPIPTFVWTFDGQGFVLSNYNIAAEAITNGKVKDVAGSYAHKLYADADSRHLIKSLERCFQDHKSIQKEFEYQPVTTNQKIWIKGTWVYIAPDKVVLHTEDISERRQALSALQETKNRYESIYHNAQVGLSRTRISDGKVLECNQKLADIFGYESIDECVTNGILSDLYVDKGIREKNLSELHQTGFVQNKEARFYRKNGQIMWARFDSRNFPEYGYMEDVIIDITEQKKAEERLLRQQKAISLNNRIANVFLTSSGNDIFSNTLDVVLGALESPFGYFGYIDEEGNLNCPSMTRNIWDKCDIPDKSIVFPKDIWGGLWGESLKKAKTIISNSGLKLPEGHIQITCAMAVPIIHHEELIGQFVVANKKEGYYQYEKYLLENAASQTAPILNSLLEKNAQAKEHKRMQARIEQAQKMEAVGNLAGGIAHDFNNLLFPIVGLAEMMLADFPLDSPEHQNLHEIFLAGKRGRELVQQILSFSRQSEQQLIPIHIQKVLKEVFKLCRATIPTDIPIRRDIQTDCGPVMADPTQIHQIVMNLITNAYHAVEPAGGTISIQLTETDVATGDDPVGDLAPGRYAMLTISDTGMGIDPAVIDKIFDPYFTTKEKGRGTGLGLATVYGIVKAYGGEIKVSSDINKGSSFQIYLPVLGKAQDSEPEKETTPLPTGTEHILLVDDEKSIIHLEKQMLERLGYQTSVFTSSRDALTEFKTEPSMFDLVITDMNMPNMNGMQLATELITIRPDIPIILCTGFSERIDNKKAEAQGIRGLLMKPVGMKDFAQKIREVLDE
jgi:PAS domain S-box-containing protein